MPSTVNNNDVYGKKFYNWLRRVFDDPPYLDALYNLLTGQPYDGRGQLPLGGQQQQPSPVSTNTGGGGSTVTSGCDNSTALLASNCSVSGWPLNDPLHNNDTTQPPHTGSDDLAGTDDLSKTIGGGGDYPAYDHWICGGDYLGGEDSSYYWPDYDNTTFTFCDYEARGIQASDLEHIYQLIRQYQWNFNIILTTLLAIVFLVGVAGNLLVLIVFARSRMRQASAVFIMALAGTDLIICLIVLPGVLLKEWAIPFKNDAVCKMWEWLRCTTIPLSSLILVAVAVDRYVLIARAAVTKPISTKCAKVILLLALLTSAGMAVPPSLGVGVYQRSSNSDNGDRGNIDYNYDYDSGFLHANPSTATHPQSTTMPSRQQTYSPVNRTAPGNASFVTTSEYPGIQDNMTNLPSTPDLLFKNTTTTVGTSFMHQTIHMSTHSPPTLSPSPATRQTFSTTSTLWPTYSPTSLSRQTLSFTSQASRLSTTLISFTFSSISIGNPNPVSHQLSDTPFQASASPATTTSNPSVAPPFPNYPDYEESDAPGEFYLGLCRSNDLLLSESSILHYWEAVAVLFLLVLVLVLVLYGLVFRAVYKHSKRRVPTKPPKPAPPTSRVNPEASTATVRKVMLSRVHKLLPYRRSNSVAVATQSGLHRKEHISNTGSNLSYSAARRNTVDNPSLTPSTDCKEGSSATALGNVGRQTTCWFDTPSSSAWPLTPAARQTPSRDTINTAWLDRCNQIDRLRRPRQEEDVTSEDDGHYNAITGPHIAAKSTEPHDKADKTLFYCVASCMVGRTKQYENYSAETKQDHQVEDFKMMPPTRDMSRRSKKTTLEKEEDLVYQRPGWLKRQVVRVLSYTSERHRQQRQVHENAVIKLTKRQRAKVRMMNEERSTWDSQDFASEGYDHSDAGPVSRDESKVAESSMCNHFMVKPPTDSEDKRQRGNFTPNKKGKDKTIQSSFCSGEELQQQINRSVHQQLLSDTQILSNYNRYPKQDCNQTTKHEEETILSTISMTKAQNSNTIAPLPNVPFDLDSGVWIGNNSSTSKTDTEPTLPTGPLYKLNQTMVSKQVTKFDKKQIPLQKTFSQQDVLTSQQARQVKEKVKDNISQQELHDVSVHQSNREELISRVGSTVTGSRSHQLYKQNNVNPCDSERIESNENASEETASEETASEETASEETASEETASEETASDETASEETASEETTSEETASEETASEETASGETASKETASEETASQSKEVSIMDSLIHSSSQTELLNQNRINPPDNLQDKDISQIENTKSRGSNLIKADTDKDTSSDIQYNNRDGQIEKPSGQAHINQQIRTKPGQVDQSHRIGQGHLQRTTPGRQSQNNARNSMCVGQLAAAKRYSRAQVKTAKVLLLVTAVFLVCYAPSLLMILHLIIPQHLIFYAYFLHSAANPLIYSFINQNFRKQLYDLVRGRGKRR